MKIDPKLQEIGDRLEQSAAAELRAEAGGLGALTRWAGRRRSRLLASSSLGLVGAGAVVLLGLTSSATTPAFAVTQHDDGSVLVQLNRGIDIQQANEKLSAMGIHEQIVLYSNPHPTAYRGPENCPLVNGDRKADPQIQLEVNTNDADNTGVTGAVLCYLWHGTYADSTNSGIWDREFRDAGGATTSSRHGG